MAKHAPSIILVYNVITWRAVAKECRKGPVQTIVRSAAALRIRDGNERGLDPLEQQSERERLARRGANPPAGAWSAFSILWNNRARAKGSPAEPRIPPAAPRPSTKAGALSVSASTPA